MKLTYADFRSAIVPLDLDPFKRGMFEKSILTKAVKRSKKRLVDTPNTQTFGHFQREFQEVTRKQNKRAKSDSQTTKHLRNYEDAIVRYNAYLMGCHVARRRLIAALDALNWKDKTIWAEIYSGNPANFGALTPYVSDLLWESRQCSGWANIDPASFDVWINKGQMEIDHLNAWPNLPANKPSFSMNVHRAAGINPADANQWPRWQPNPGFARKGLFCHSSSAIAANVAYNGRANLNQRFWKLRSIDIIQQQADRTGGMCHWWVCVNRPEKIYFNGKEIDMGIFGNIEKYLEVCGGFVVDIWGALYKLGHGTANAYQQNLEIGDCVWSAPNRNFLKNYELRVAKRWVNPDVNAYKL